MKYDELLNQIKQSNTWELEHLHSSWSIAIPSVLVKYDRELTSHIPVEWYGLCQALFYVNPEGAVNNYLKDYGYKQVEGDERTINYQSTILLNHSCKTYVVFGGILEVLENGVITQYETNQ